ncbi:MAG: hypothetical protein QM578_05285 [Pantoea sp.]|uniref:hypothetical protein n=1 Tax=Pantoea sp. TaxID=69393 RepID=UPI0039E6247B
MADFGHMADAQLDAEIDRLVREIAEFENGVETEEIDLIILLISDALEDTSDMWRQAMNEKHRRMGRWIAP